MLQRDYAIGAIVFLFSFAGAGIQPALAAIPSNTGASPASCVIAKFTGAATTYNPACENETPALSTGGRYNAAGWEAALQLDLAKRFRCGYRSRCYAAVENLNNGRAAILLINDNGPLYSGSYGNRNTVIDLNEASMRYLANDPSGAQHGNCKGVLPRVSVTLLCRLIGQPGPLNEEDRLAWSKITAAIPSTQLPTNLLSQSPFAGVSPFSNVPAAPGYPGNSFSNVMPAPALAPTPVSASQNYPSLQPIPGSSVLAASQADPQQAEDVQTQSQSVSELLHALAAPTSSAIAFSVRTPFSLTERIGSENASGLTAANATGTPVGSQTPPSGLPQSTNTFPAAGYQSPDLRWSAWNTVPFFRTLFLEIESIIRNIINLAMRL